MDSHLITINQLTTIKITVMKTTLANVNYYLDLVNRLQRKPVKLYRANGTNYIKDLSNETIFSGTLSECYYFLLGVSRMF